MCLETKERDAFRGMTPVTPGAGITHTKFYGSSLWGEKEKSVNWGLPRVGGMSLKVCVLNPWWGRGQAVKPESGMYWTQKACGK